MAVFYTCILAVNKEGGVCDAMSYFSNEADLEAAIEAAKQEANGQGWGEGSGLRFHIHAREIARDEALNAFLAKKSGRAGRTEIHVPAKIYTDGEEEPWDETLED